MSTTRDEKDIRPFVWRPLDGDQRSSVVPPEGSTQDAKSDRATTRKFELQELVAIRTGGTGPAGAEEPFASAVDTRTAELEQARRKAEEIVAKAKSEAKTLRAEARNDGYAAGLAEGRSHMETMAERAEVLISELTGYKVKLFEEAKDQLQELVIAMVEKLIGPLSEDMPGAVAQYVVEKAITLLSDREVLSIRVNPDDLAALLDAKPGLLAAFDGIQKLTILEDPSVKPGGCLVQTPTTEIDGRLETQLQHLVRAIRTIS